MPGPALPSTREAHFSLPARADAFGTTPGDLPSHPDLPPCRRIPPGHRPDTLTLIQASEVEVRCSQIEGLPEPRASTRRREGWRSERSGTPARHTSRVRVITVAAERGGEPRQAVLEPEPEHSCSRRPFRHPLERASDALEVLADIAQVARPGGGCQQRAAQGGRIAIRRGVDGFQIGKPVCILHFTHPEIT